MRPHNTQLFFIRIISSLLNPLLKGVLEKVKKTVGFPSISGLKKLIISFEYT